MKHAVLFAATAAAALSLAACEDKSKAPEAAGIQTTAPEVPAADAAAQDAAAADAAAGPIDPVPPRPPAAAPAAGPVASGQTEAVINGMALSDLYQLEAGKIAEAKAQAPAVKDFAKSMVADHGSMTAQMKHLFAATKVTVPTELGPRGKRMIEALNAAAPAEFDRVYLNQQQAAQAAELAVLRVYAEAGESSDLRPAAEKRIPKVQASLDKVQELQAAQSQTAAAQ